MELIVRIGNIVEVPVPIEKGNKVNQLLHKQIDQLEKGCRITKAEFKEHGRDMDAYALQVLEESIEGSKLEL